MLNPEAQTYLYAWDTTAEMLRVGRRRADGRGVDRHLRLVYPLFLYVWLVLLCYNRLTPQNGHWQSWRSRERARMMRKVAMECGLCLSGRMRTSGFEVGRQFGR